MVQVAAAQIGRERIAQVDPELWAAMEEHRAHLDASGALSRNRRSRLVREVEGLSTERLRGRIRSLVDAEPGLADDLLERRTDPYAAAAILVRRVGTDDADP